MVLEPRLLNDTSLTALLGQHLLLPGPGAVPPPTFDICFPQASLLRCPFVRAPCSLPAYTLATVRTPGEASHHPLHFIFLRITGHNLTWHLLVHSLWTTSLRQNISSWGQKSHGVTVPTYLKPFNQISTQGQIMSPRGNSVIPDSATHLKTILFQKI